MSAMFFFLFLLNEMLGEIGKLREKRPRVKCLDRAGGSHLLQAMSMGSVKPGGVCAEASGCTCRPGGGGERDVDDGSCVLKMLEKAGVVVVELNQACSAAGLFRDNSSRLQHANISVMSGPWLCTAQLCTKPARQYKFYTSVRQFRSEFWVHA